MRIRYIFIILLLLISGTFVLGADEYLEFTFNDLEQGIWQQNANIGNCLDFHYSSLYNPILTFSISYDDELPWESGFIHITIGKGGVSFQKIDGDYSKMPNDFFDQVGVLLKSNENLLYNEYLKLTPSGAQYWNFNSKVQPGDIKIIDGNEVIIINQYGTTNNNLSVRNGPGTNYAKYSLSMYNDQTYYPPETQLFVYARTEMKQKIGEWNAYWYCVHVAEHMMSSKTDPNATKKWVYGEFVDFKN